jgi:hypothetical protein
MSQLWPQPDAVATLHSQEAVIGIVTDVIVVRGALLYYFLHDEIF